MEAPINLTKYVFRHLADKLRGAAPETIVAYYIEHLVFANEGYLDYLIDKYKLPKKDILKIHAKIELLSKGGKGNETNCNR